MRTVVNLAAAAIVAGAVLSGPTPAVAQFIESCAGDIDGDGHVTVDELVTGVAVALKRLPLNAGRIFDRNGNGNVQVHELIQGLNAALGVTPCSPTDRVADDEVVEASSRVVIATVGSYRVLAFGFLGARPSAFSTLSPARGSGQQEASRSCANGGTRTVSCSDSVLTEVLNGCREETPTGEIEQNGRRVVTVADPGFCETLRVPDGTEAAEILEHFAVRFSCERDCGSGLEDGELRSRRLSIRRTTDDGVETTVLGGDLTTINAQTEERFGQTFTGFVIEREIQGEETAFTLEGITAVDCLGPIELDTKVPIRLVDGSECPTDGSFEVMRDSGLPKANRNQSIATMQPVDLTGRSSGAGAGDLPDASYRELVYRAANGQVYQVMQNVRSSAGSGDGVIGASDVHITTAVGSTSSQLGGCFKLRAAQAFVATDTGTAFPLDRVFKSDVIADASEPCFNPFGGAGDGAVCIGPECTRDCVCAPGARCARFTLDGADPISEDGVVPGAILVDPLTSVGGACSGFLGAVTYGFGSNLPTTEQSLCAPVPQDGFTLLGADSDFQGAAGSTVVLVYAAPLLEPFGVGSAGFAIDSDGGFPEGCEEPNAVISGVIDAHSLPPNFVQYTQTGAVRFDINGDTTIDKEASSCAARAMPRCAVSPIPLPPPAPPGQCAPALLSGSLPLSRTGRTSERSNTVGGATCGGGGNRAADLTFRFTAPRAAFYRFRTSPASFDTVLYVRDQNCAGRELACNDDRGNGSLESEVGLPLAAQQTVIIAVDGFRRENGDFTLSVSADEDEPTPTPTATPEPASQNPDLFLSEVSAPPTGMSGQSISVSATVSNAGLADAGSFQVEFVFSLDAIIDSADIASGFGCVFSSLGGQATVPCTGPIVVPESLPTGRYFLVALVDDPGVVPESDETNNAGVGGPIDITGASPTATPTSTVTDTATTTPTTTPTPPQPSPLPTASATRSGTHTSTATQTPTSTDTETPMPAPSSTSTAAPNFTATSTPVPTSSPTSTSTRTPSSPPTETATTSRTPTGTQPPSPTITRTPTASFAPSPSRTFSVTRTATRTPTPSPTSTETAPPTPTVGTTVGGAICQNTTWSLAGSPYVATMSVVVGGPLCGGQPVTLSIEAGVQVRFTAGALLQVNATLHALGTEVAPILFTSNVFPQSPGNWDGIRFSDTSQDAAFDEAGNYVGGSILRHAIVRFAKGSSGFGVVAANSSSPFFHALTIRDPGGTSAGIAITGPLSQPMKVIQCVVEENTGIGLLVSGLVNLEVRESVFSENSGDGVRGTSFVGTQLQLVGITAENNGGAGVNITAGPVTITDSVMRGNGGHGISDGASGTTQVTVANNLLFGNAGLGFRQSFSHNLSVTGNCIAANTGGGATFSNGPSIQFNTFADNVQVPVAVTFTENNVVASGIGFTMTSGNSAGTLLAPNNWWGSADPGVIPEVIFDGFDDGSRAFVGFQPPAQGPVPGAPGVDDCSAGVLTPTAP